MKKILILVAFVITLISCNSSKEKEILTNSPWISANKEFSAVTFTDDGYGYDLINIADTLKYKFEDNFFLMIDTKGDQERTLKFDLKKLDKDSLVLEINKGDGLRLKFRRALNSELLYGSWLTKEGNFDISYTFLSPADSGSGFRYNKANEEVKEFFSYLTKDNFVTLSFNGNIEKYQYSFDKSFHKLNLKSEKRNLDFIRTKIH